MNSSDVVAVFCEAMDTQRRDYLFLCVLPQADIRLCFSPGRKLQLKIKKNHYWML